MDIQQIPQFPQFKEISINDKSLIREINRNYLPYSDFNFTNLWTWDVLGSRMIAKLNDNLVLLLTDYRTAAPILSFIGHKKAEETAVTILKHAANLNAEPILKFIPEETAKLLFDSNLKVLEDNDNHDYIFSTGDMANPTASNLKTKRRLANKFLISYPQIVVRSEIFSDSVTQKNIFDVLYRWEQNKKNSNKTYEIMYEEIALRRLMSTAHEHDLVLTCIYDAGIMIAFSIDELLHNSYAISHFIKADIKYKGVYEHLNQVVATELLKSGAEYWNWEQDLNLEGLRQLKMSYRPARFLKKYEVSLP